MRGNTVPPPSVRLGAEQQPRPENDPVSTSRPRNDDETIPKLGRPPADLIDAARRPEVEATTKTPPVVVSPAPSPVPPPRDPLPTLLSAQQRAVEDDEPPPSLAPRSMNGTSLRRGKRGSNLRARSAPPPSMTSGAPPYVSERNAAIQPSDAGAKEVTTKAEAPTTDSPSDEAAHESAPASAIPQSDLDHPGFFDRHEDGELSDLDTYDERMAHKNTPAAIAAREKNWMYIKIIGGVCVLLMVAGLVRSKLAPVEEPTSISPPVVVAPPPSSAATALAKIEPPQPPSPPSPAASASAASAIPVASADDLPAAAGSAKGEAVVKPAAGDLPVVVTPPPGPAAEPTDAEKKSAVQEKHAAQAFLDQGAFAKAVEAGEKSVSLDPSDGEAWLMLGAAYQSMGKSAEARRSFSSCVQEGKKGPINECRAMLR